MILELPSFKYYDWNLGQVFKFKNVIKITAFGKSVCRINGQLNLVWALSFMLHFLTYKGKKHAEIDTEATSLQN